MSNKKVNQKFYSDCRLYGHGKNVGWGSNPEGWLYANDTYPTKLKAEDLPEYFVKVTHWVNYYYDVSNLQDIAYIPNRLMGNNTLKYDRLLISYDKDIKIVKKDYNDEYTADWESYDRPFDGWYTEQFLPIIEKYNPHLKEKIDKIWEIYNQRYKEVVEQREKEGNPYTNADEKEYK